MPKITLAYTDAQLESLRLRFPGETKRNAFYRALGFDPPAHGGTRKGAGRKKAAPTRRPRASLKG